MPDFPFIPAHQNVAEFLGIKFIGQETFDRAEAHDELDQPILLVSLGAKPVGKLSFVQTIALLGELNEFVAGQLTAIHRSLTHRARHSPPRQPQPGRASSAAGSAPMNVGKDFTDLPTVSLGQYIAQVRSDKGISRAEVERDSKLPFSSISSIERGDWIPSDGKLEQLGNGLNVPYGLLQRMADRDRAVKGIRKRNMRRESA